MPTFQFKMITWAAVAPQYSANSAELKDLRKQHQDARKSAKTESQNPRKRFRDRGMRNTVQYLII